MPSKFAVYSFVCCIFSFSLAHAQPAPESRALIKSFSYQCPLDPADPASCGCPVGSAQGMLAQDGSVFTVTYERFIAEDGPNTNPLDARKRCQLVLELDVPRGYQFSIERLNTTGYVDLDPKTVARLAVRYKFRGANREMNLQKKYVGPLTQDFVVTDGLIDESKQLVWSKCGKAHELTITTELHAKAKGENNQGYAAIGVDLQDGLLIQTLALKARKCR